MIAEKVLESIWDLYGIWIQKQIRIERADPSDLVQEFFFVLLGGFGISYEQNKSALKVIKQKGFIDFNLYRDAKSTPLIEQRLREEFETKQFEPLTISGEYRKYRFTKTKPDIIVAAGQWLWAECNWDLKIKIEDLGCQKSRKWLCNCPGLGMKSASWFLRNTGYNQDCAVFDVHILRFLRRIGLEVPRTLTDYTYIKLENELRDICNRIGVRLGIMDYLLWILGRNGYLNNVG